MKVFFILPLFLICGLVTNALVFRRWTQNTNFENRYNWNKGRVPCGNERVIIPDESPSVYVQINASLGELVLPMDGEIIFGDNIALSFTDQPDYGASCLESDTDIQFNATHTRSWFDPLNWCATDTENDGCIENSLMSLLDAERIPCTTDDVIFPPKSTYFVDIGSGADIEIKTLKIGSQTFTSATLANYMTDDGRTMFPLPSSGSPSVVTVNRKPCNDRAGCKCGNDHGQIMTNICEIEFTRCHIAKCSGAFGPVGHCCPVCGMMISLTYGVGFGLSKLRDTVLGNLQIFRTETTGASDVKLIISRTFEDKIQIVITDLTGDQSKKAGAAFQKIFQTDIDSGGATYGLTGMEVSMSGASRSAAAQTGSSGGMSTGGIVGVVLCVILAIVLVVVVLGYLARKRGGLGLLNASAFADGISFRGGQSLGKPSAHVAPTIEFKNIKSTSDNVAFDNPLYGGSKTDSGTGQVEPPIYSTLNNPEGPAYANKGGFDNPLYDTTDVLTSSFYTDPSDPGSSSA